MELADRAKKRRLELGLSQEEVAKRMGYSSRTSINKIENGRQITQKIIIRLADALETSPAYLMGWTDDIPEFENRPDALIENYKETAKYILEHEDKELLKVYSDLVRDENLVLLVKKASKLSPQDIVQLLKIVSTFDTNDTSKDEKDNPID